jgi:DNA polymerase-3 subunit delta'
MSWKGIIGQQQITATFASLIEKQRLAHAYIFSGAEGVGKEAVALELAKALNCERQKSEACDACPSCLKFFSLQHPNLSLVFALPVGKGEKLGDNPTAKLSEGELTAVQEQIALKAKNVYHHISLPRATTIKINSIREIRKESSMSSFFAGKKVFLIIDAENLSDESSNALLKTLEEPHDNILIILTVRSVETLLPTIVSRCQHIRFPLIDTKEISAALSAREGIQADSAELTAKLSQGSYARALNLLGTDIEERRRDAVEFLRTVLYKSRKDVLSVVDQLATDYDKEALAEFLMILQSWLRDSMLVGHHEHSAVATEDITALKKFSAHYPGLHYGRLFEAVEKAISLLDKNVYIQLTLLTLALDLRRTILSDKGQP